MDISTEDRIERLSLGISALRIRLGKINPCHVKSGPQGGQFCETGGGSAAAGGGVSSSASAKERNAVKSYKGADYMIVNPYLRGRSDMEPATKQKAQEIVTHLDSLMEKSKLTKDVVLYRGISGKEFGKNAAKLVGKEIPASGFQSTSWKRDVAEVFAGSSGVMMRISAKAGKRAVEADSFPPASKNSEIILPRNTRYKVTGFKKGDPPILDVEVV